MLFYFVSATFLKNSQFSIINKNRKEIEYVKDVYKRRVQIEADSFLGQEEKPDTIIAQDVLYLDKICF